MKNTVLISLFSAMIGAGVMAFVVTRHYQKMLNELEDELTEIVEKYCHTDSEPVETDETKEEPYKEPRVFDWTPEGCDEDEFKNRKSDEIHIISPDEFGEDEEYERITLMYYTDGVVADDFDTLVTSGVTGIDDVASHFGEYEDDVIYVKNDTLKLYFEICRSEKSFKEITDEKKRGGVDD